MPTFKTLPLDDLADLSEGAVLARERLAIAEQTSPNQQLETLDNYLVEQCALGAKGLEIGDWEELAFLCGSLWGEQLVKALDWRWIRVQFDQHLPDAIGVAPPDGSLVIYPFHSIFLCSEQRFPVRIARSLAVLSEPGRVPMLPPGGLENVMEHID